MSTLPGIERRITLRMLSYWEKIRAGRAMPTAQDFNSADLEDRWDSCFLIYLKDNSTPDHTNTYIGKAILEAYRHGLTGDEDHMLISPDVAMFLLNHQQILKSTKPLLEEGEFENFLLGTVKYRQCLLPLGENGKLTAILGGMHFKIFLPGSKA